MRERGIYPIRKERTAASSNIFRNFSRRNLPEFNITLGEKGAAWRGPSYSPGIKKTERERAVVVGEKPIPTHLGSTRAFLSANKRPGTREICIFVISDE